MIITANSYTNFIKSLLNAGVTDLALINWVRQPVRVKGQWVAEIKV
jgi:hypothetical protein